MEYRYRQGRLERLSYPSLGSPQAAARSVLLLPEVTRFRLRFYLQGEWLTAWRAGGLLPQAVEIVVETPRWGGAPHRHGARREAIMKNNAVWRC
ncbi:type II secretion system protein GspJ [Serratia ureilytica]